MDVARDHGVDFAFGEHAGSRGAEAVAVAREIGLGVAAATRCRRAICEPVARASGEKTEGRDRQRVPEDGPDPAVAALGSTQRVAVGEEEREAVVVHDVRVVQELDAQLALEPAGSPARAHPVVVVAAHERDLDVARAGALERPQHGPMAPRRLGVVEPEVEQVAEQIKARTRLEPVEEGDEVPLLRGLDGWGVSAEMNVRQESDDRHGSRK